MFTPAVDRSSARLEAVLAGWGRVVVWVLLVVVVAADWIGWAAGIDALTRGFASWPQVTPWSAAMVACLGLAALALSGSPRPARVWVGAWLATVAGVLAAVFLFEYVTGTSSALDQLWFSESASAQQRTWPGRPSPQTAVSVLLLSVAVALTRLDRRRPPVAWGVTLAAAAVTPLIVVYAYWLRPLPLVGATPSTGMEISTALAVLLLISAVIAARPDRSPVARLLTHPDGWAVVLMVAVLAGPPILIGFLRLSLLHVGAREDAAWMLSIAVSTAALGAAAFCLTQRGCQQLLHGNRKLRESQERVRSIVRNAPAAISIRDRDNGYELVNQAFCDLFGLADPGQALGRHTADLLPPDVVVAMRGAEERALRGESTRVEHEVTVGDVHLTVDAQVFPLGNVNLIWPHRDGLIWPQSLWWVGCFGRGRVGRSGCRFR